MSLSTNLPPEALGLTLPTILCCVCGTCVQPNATGMCIACLRDTVDLSQEINTKVSIHSCRSCNRFLGPPWQQVELESKELMIMCLRKVNGLQKVRVVDAAWIWTEPHSMRLKIKLTIQKEIVAGAIIQQSPVVDFTVRNQQCKHCEASYATGAWHAIVQVRQRVPHKRTFLYLEQLILKNEAHSETMKIVTFRDGMDFYYKDKNQGLRFIEFLSTHVPTKTKYSRKLVSADINSGTADYKHNYLIEIAPLCKDDLVLLPKELAAKQSNISPLVLVKKVAAGIHFIDPLSGERTEVDSEKYFRTNFNSLLSSKDLARFIVLSVEPIIQEHRPSARMKRVKVVNKNGNDNNNGTSMKTVASTTASVRATSKLAECVIMRERDFGVNDTQFTVVTHLGALLCEGDVVLGYDLVYTSLNMSVEDEELFDKVSSKPDIILVRKLYEYRERNWTLKSLDAEAAEGAEGEAKKKKGNRHHYKDTLISKVSGETYEADLEDFLQQVEGDRELRANINLYKATDGKAIRQKKTVTMETTSDDGDSSNRKQRDYDDEEIRLDELLDDMTLAAQNGEEGEGEGDAGNTFNEDFTFQGKVSTNNNNNTTDSSSDSNWLKDKQSADYKFI